MKHYGRSALAALIRRHGPTEVARSLGLAPVTARGWASGSAEPRAAGRKKLLDVYGIAWGPKPPKDGTESLLTRTTDVTKMAVAVNPPPAEAQTIAPVDALREAEETVRQLRALVDKLHADPAASAREYTASESSTYR